MARDFLCLEDSGQGRVAVCRSGGLRTKYRGKQRRELDRLWWVVPWGDFLTLGAFERSVACLSWSATVEAGAESGEGRGQEGMPRRTRIGPRASGTTVTCSFSSPDFSAGRELRHQTCG